MTEAWAQQNPDTLQALLRALICAAAWADAPEHRRELATLLARPEHVGASREIIEASLAGMVFDAGGANAPAPVHAAWLAGQMQRWGHIAADQDLAALAAQVYRPDLHAQARAALGLAPVSLPNALSEFAPQ